MIAIPVLRSRVAPVLNWCSSIRLFPADPSYEGVGQEVDVTHLGIWERLELLRNRGAKVLICGALSPEVRHYAKKLGITLVCGVAGGIEEVRRSYWRNQLDQPEFWLPGCRGPRRYRSGFRGGRGCSGQGSCRERLPPSSPKPRVAEQCFCPACGLAVPHEPGIPCQQVACPGCGRPLVRG
ncbi:MAG: NifB/NifX family molybdenum-iron cluster-binding protein [Desulfobaccales bacterium]